MAGPAGRPRMIVRWCHRSQEVSSMKCRAVVRVETGFVVAVT